MRRRLSHRSEMVSRADQRAFVDSAHLQAGQHIAGSLRGALESPDAIALANGMFQEEAA